MSPSAPVLPPVTATVTTSAPLPYTAAVAQVGPPSCQNPNWVPAIRDLPLPPR